MLKKNYSICAFSHLSIEKSALEQLCLVWQYWTATATLEALQSPEYSLFYVCQPEQKGSEDPWQAAVLLHQGPFSSDIMYLFVLPQARRLGLGLALLERCWEKIQALPSQESLFLEVRASNTAAIALYTKAFEMQPITRRIGYYSDGEDALVLCKEKGECG